MRESEAETGDTTDDARTSTKLSIDCTNNMMIGAKLSTTTKRD